MKKGRYTEEQIAYALKQAETHDSPFQSAPPRLYQKHKHFPIALKSEPAFIFVNGVLGCIFPRKK